MFHRRPLVKWALSIGATTLLAYVLWTASTWIAYSLYDPLSGNSRVPVSEAIAESLKVLILVSPLLISLLWTALHPYRFASSIVVRSLPVVAVVALFATIEVAYYCLAMVQLALIIPLLLTVLPAVSLPWILLAIENTYAQTTANQARLDNRH